MSIDILGYHYVRTSSSTWDGANVSERNTSFLAAVVLIGASAIVMLLSIAWTVGWTGSCLWLTQRWRYTSASLVVIVAGLAIGIPFFRFGFDQTVAMIGVLHFRSGIAGVVAILSVVVVITPVLIPATI